MTKNQQYEAKQKAKGLTKVTLWVPATAAIEFKSMAAFCCGHPNHIPFMTRSTITGKLKKGV
ncbi:hypothetical protein L2750_12850 [Shewanella submarina]|uniref:Uncharacterized protein n=1 Tax=Shewanella submarina TaxID=2016376 RepID=A0ABV7GDN9_9GAMM|nr:hypothetical protein [Shewanella submarina]MCL1038038.1 hypothetical protein [Shewanella submarina]